MGPGAAAVAAVALTGCGGAKHAQAPRQPALPRSLASELALRSEAVADALAGGDSCRARALAQQLQARTISGINARRVPAGLQEQLSSATNQLVTRISCTSVTASHSPPAKEERPKPEDHGKKRGHRKHGRGKADADD
jgi:hypothetical protein